MKFYETTIVIDSLQKPDNIQNTITKIQSFIKNNGGEIAAVDEWGKKRLAYEIKRRQYGTYFQIYFKGAGTLPNLLEREFLLEESILRYLTLVFEPKLFQDKVAAIEEKTAPKPVATKPVDTKPVDTKPETEKPAEEVATDDQSEKTTIEETAPDVTTEAEQLSE